MIRVGIMGMGGMGRGRLPLYRDIAGAQVVAIGDIRAETLRQDETLSELLEIAPSEMRWFEDLAQLVSSGRVDMVDICLPTGCHRQASEAALDAGLHVLCEKPMALSSADCDAMVAASERAQRNLMIAQCIRFWPEYQHLADLRASGEAGRLLSLQLSRQGAAPSRTWFCRTAESGGALLDLHIHDIDYCHHLLGLPRRVYAQGGMGQGPEAGYDFCLSNLDYGPETQVSATAQWSKAPIPFSARYEARFEEAFLRFDSSQSPTLTVYRVDAEPEQPTFGPDSAYTNEIRYFLSCIERGERPARCTPQQTRDSVALIEAIRASLQQQEMVSIDGSETGAPASGYWGSSGVEWLI